MRNASGYQGENERQWKKQSEQEHKHSFLHKRVNRKLKEVSRFSRAKVVQNNGKKIYKKVCYRCKVVFLLISFKKRVLHVRSCFFAN